MAGRQEKIFGNFGSRQMIDSLPKLLTLMKEHGATRVYAKRLSPNDNSKNQVYLGGDFSALNIIPHHAIETDNTPAADAKRERLKAKVTFSWINESGAHSAPAAQLILYPRYPEVRFSGFLIGSRGAPSNIMTTRDDGRLLVLGISPTGQIFGFAASPSDPISRELFSRTGLRQTGVFLEIPFDVGSADSRSMIVSSLKKIHHKGWIQSQKLTTANIRVPYSAPNAGGLTLEAELGIIPNGRSEPDYHGWEVKQYGVVDFRRFRARSPITLMTPEPTGGIYGELGIATFMSRFAYPDAKGRADRRNFGGVYSCNRGFHPTTGLRLGLVGYSSTRKTDIDMIRGGISLSTKEGEIAAFWPFTGLMNHWNRKHNQAVYVPSLFRSPPPEYAFGEQIRLCEQTDFFLLLDAIEIGIVYYDPAIKIVGAESPKRRSQFRIKEPSITRLYAKHETVNLKLP